MGPGPGLDPFGLVWGARVLGWTLLVWLGGPGSWAGPFWFGLRGLGPGPDPFGLAWGARVLGRTLLVWLGGPGSWAGPAYTINTLDNDMDVNIMGLLK
jgi:hypothetical protein